MAKYIIGIDLGTTNSAVAYLPIEAEDAGPQIFYIDQIVAPGEIDSLQTLPSFVYIPDDNEMAAGSLNLPWTGNRDYCVGAHARKNASMVPGKTIASAKSWLCATNVDRLSPILPWARENAEKKISPVEAARRLLEHVQGAWNARMAVNDDAAQFAGQEIILTVPASFDAIARELTVRAADAAGLSITLLEEPQAAFYAWLQEQADGWRDKVSPGDLILVCDVGGGTTDFSLIQVVDEEGNLGLERIAVGDHILLGGDNMDLALAYTVAQRLQREKNIRLDPHQINGLTHACREAKEVLCRDPEAPPQKLTVLGRGSSLIGGTISTELTFNELQGVLVDGFFPVCQIGDTPKQQSKAGLRAFGLDYAADPAITKHLAAFVSRQGKDTQTVLPTAVLFNGGVTKAIVLQQRVVDTLNRWRETGPIKVLTGNNPDLAVAAGACWYGRVRRGGAIRIKAGSPHAYYVGIESTMPAIPGFTPPLQGLCVVPMNMEEGTQEHIRYNGLGLLVGEKTEFRFFASNIRTNDCAADVLPDTDTPELHELPPLKTELAADNESTPAGTLVPVHLKAVLSEIGTLELWCLEDDGTRQWKLQYELRSIEFDQE